MTMTSAANNSIEIRLGGVGGQGIALGWTHLIEPMLASGLLRRASDHLLHTENAFHVVWPTGRPLTEPMRQVRDWLLSGVAA